MSVRRVLAIALPVVALVGLGLWVARQPAVSMPVSPSALATPMTAAAPSARQSIEATAPRTNSAASTAPVAAAAASVPASLAARVDAWAHSGDPHDAMQAYKAIFYCMQARNLARATVVLPPNLPRQHPTQLCGDLRSDQIQQRLAWLETAARAGEQDAAWNFMLEGPSGNGMLMGYGTADPTPPTPDWLARRDDYIERGLAACDRGLVAYLSAVSRNHDQQALIESTQYWLGRLSCPGNAVAANTTPLAEDPQAKAYLDGLVINHWQP